MICISKCCYQVFFFFIFPFGISLGTLFVGKFDVVCRIFSVDFYSYSNQNFDGIRNSNHVKRFFMKGPPMSNLLWHNPDHDVIGYFVS